MSSTCPWRSALYEVTLKEKPVLPSLIQPLRQLKRHYVKEYLFTNPPNPHIPLVYFKDENDICANIEALQEKGPEAFFYQLAQRHSSLPIFGVKLGNQYIYGVQNSSVARQLLQQHTEQLGRGSAFNSFKSMIGDVFFVQDSENIARDRSRFLCSVNRTSLNFYRIQAIAEQSMEFACSLKENQDFYKWVSNYAISTIASCFVGIKKKNGIGENAFKIFLDAGRDITHAGIDPFSRMISPQIRRQFRQTKSQMDKLWKEILKDNLDDICEGNNYIWDLARDKATELYPDKDFEKCEFYEKGNEASEYIRQLIQTDKWVRESGPTTIFATMNVGRSIAFMLDMLEQKPHLWQQIQEEVNKILKEKEFTPQALKEFSLVHAVVMESLWQLTPIPQFPREALEDFSVELEGTKIDFRKGDLFMLLFTALQGGPRPFDPEYWRGERTKPEFWAFGRGNRSCPAQRFAIQMMEQLIVNMAIKNALVVPQFPLQYTTYFGGLGPVYHEKSPTPLRIVSA